MTRSNKEIDEDIDRKIDEDIAKMFKSSHAYSKDRETNMGYLDTIVSEFLDKLKEMKLEPHTEKEIRSSVGNILEFAKDPSHSEIFPGEVDYLLLRIRMPPRTKARSPKKIVHDIFTQWAFRDLNALSPDFISILIDSISKLPSDIYEWTKDSIRFISSMEESLAFNLHIGIFIEALGAPFNIKGFIFLCENLKYEKKEVQTKVIAHEIAHLKLGHTRPVLSNAHARKQEEEADKLAEEWLAHGHSS